MAERGNYVGVDILKPAAPTPEKQAEIEAEEAASSFLDQDLSTPDGAAKAMRPAAVLLAIKAAFGIFFAIAIGFTADWSQLGNTSLPADAYDEVNQAAYLSIANAIAAALAIPLSIFLFAKSRIAAVLAALWVVEMWLSRVWSLINRDFSGLLYGTIFLIVLTGAVAWAVQASFAYHRLKRSTTADGEALTP